MITVSQPPKLTPLDEQTFNARAQMIKAALPYIGLPSAKPMALLARFMELQSTLRYFSNSGKIRACAIGSRRPTPEEMLSDLRKYCDGNEAETIDRLLNAMKIGHFYEKFRDLENNPAFSQLLHSMNTGGFHNASSKPQGGDTMGQSFNPEQLLKNIPPELLKNFNPDMLKNFDVNKFNQLMQAFNNGAQAGQPAGSNAYGARAAAGSSANPGSAYSSGAGAANRGNAYTSGGAAAGSSTYGSNAGPAGSSTYGSGAGSNTYGNGAAAAGSSAPASGFNEEQLKALLTPEQLKLFESLKKSMS